MTKKKTQNTADNDNSHASVDISEEFDTSENDAYNDDVTIEEHATEADRTKALRAKLKRCIEEKQEYLDGWQRAQADLVNSKKQTEVERKNTIQYACTNLLMELTPVIDSFEMAFANKEAWESVDEGWRKGVEYIHSQFMTVLSDSGITLLDPIGEAFDPQRHDSIESVHTDVAAEDNTIVGVVQKGILLHDKVIRPARVKVAIHKA